MKGGKEREGEEEGKEGRRREGEGRREGVSPRGRPCCAVSGGRPLPRPSAQRRSVMCTQVCPRPHDVRRRGRGREGKWVRTDSRPEALGDVPSHMDVGTWERTWEGTWEGT